MSRSSHAQVRIWQLYSSLFENGTTEQQLDWHPHSAYWLAIDLNLRIFERVFVDLDLCRNKDWVPFPPYCLPMLSAETSQNNACKGYSTSAIATAAALMGYRWWLRPFVAPFLKESKDLNRHIRALQSHLHPLLQMRYNKSTTSGDIKRF